MSITMKQICFAIFTFLVYAFMVPPTPNWLTALLLVVGVGFHEYSHLWAAKRIGLRTGGFYLIPFIGGVSFVTSKYYSYSQQAFVAIMGPVGGGLLAIVATALYLFTGLPFMAAAAYWMCFLNLFNLLPLSFLDGGQLLGTITYSIDRTLGMVLNVISTAVAVVFIWFFNPMIAILILWFGGRSTYNDIINWKNYQYGNKHLCDHSYLYPPKKLSIKQIILVLVSWMMLTSLLTITMYFLKALPASSMDTLIHH